MGASWRLECILAEGMSPDMLAGLAPESRSLQLPSEGPMPVGRMHQLHTFETLLANVPSLLNFISRSHMKLEVLEDKKVQVTNISGNPLYLNQSPLSKDDSQTVNSEVDLSFAKLELGTHVFFLTFRLLKTSQ